MKALQIPQISTGDILRANIAAGTELGDSAKALMDRGQLVPDHLVNNMIALRLAERDVRDGYILDGYPRTIGQANWLDSYLGRDKSAQYLVAMKIHVAHEELLRRITGRRTCAVCLRIYNLYSHVPETDGICDFDGAALLQRSDDTESAFYERMRAYEALTTPVIEHYEDAGRFREVSGAGAVEDVQGRILDALRELRGSRWVGLPNTSGETP